MLSDLEILSKYESWFYTAVNSDYIRALWKNDFEILVPIYEKWTNTKLNLNMSCGKCRLAFIQKLGKLYYKNKEEYESKSNSESGEKDELHEQGRKRAIRQKSVPDSKVVSKRGKSKTNKN